MSETHLMIISNRDALSWVVTEQRMAFPAGRSRLARSVREGDEVLLYTTRGCFGNPTRDRGRLMGRATVSSPVHVLPEPLHLGERVFPEECSLDIHALADWRRGIVLSDLVPRLEVFPDPSAWSVRMRRAVLTLPITDAKLLRTTVAPLLRPYSEAVDVYRQA
ncbi:hypothetical protein [Streptomyces xiamenensis]|uniref:hypothetical protein n=1 Tax=Streptomyces xiamenensis TaxID=408015 RepID=UPI0035E23D29